MKKKNTQTNAKEPKSVFIENLPKPKRWWQEYVPLFIAILALLVSIYSANESRKEFVAANRPYVFASPRSITKNGTTNMDINTFILRCLNAPAKIRNQNIDCLILNTKENGEEEVVKTISVNKRLDCDVLYPSENTTMQMTIRYNLIKDALEANPENKLRIKIRLEYKEFSTDRKYLFEGYWDYNRKYNVWEMSSVLAD